jgi:putative phosphoesterase
MVARLWVTQAGISNIRLGQQPSQLGENRLVSVRLGIISDAHGNAAGLSLCLDFLSSLPVDRVIFLGDAVGYLPEGAGVCRLLEQAGALCLKGNHEAMLFGELKATPETESIAGIKRFGRGLPEGWLKQVKKNGAKLSLEIQKRRLLLVHGSTVDPLEGYVHDPAELAGSCDTDAIIMGHTHRPFIHKLNGCLYLNPGSCGLPRDCGDLLSVAVLELPTMRAQVYRLPFQASQSIRGQVHPDVRQCLDRRCQNAFGEVQGGVQ